MNVQSAHTWKEGLARLARQWPFDWFMSMGVRLAVPRQRIGVALVAFNTNAEILLLRHVFHPAAPWGLPGGWLNRNEDPAAGVVREMREETGLGVRLGPPIYISHESTPPHLGIAFLGWVEPGSPQLSPEILEVRWCNPQQLSIRLLPFTRRAISAACKATQPGSAGEWLARPSLPTIAAEVK